MFPWRRDLKPRPPLCIPRLFRRPRATMDGSQVVVGILALRYCRVFYGFAASPWTASGRSDRSNQQLRDPRSCYVVWRHAAKFPELGHESSCETPIELKLDRRNVGAGAGKDLPADCGFSAHPQLAHDSSVGMKTPRHAIQLIDVKSPYFYRFCLTHEVVDAT